MPTALRTGSRYGYQPFVFDPFTVHSVGIASVVSGAELGLCKKCSVKYSSFAFPPEGTEFPRDWYLEDLLAAWDDMNTSPKTPATSILNLSWGQRQAYFVPAFIKRLYYILKKMDQVRVVSACVFAIFEQETASLQASKSFTLNNNNISYRPVLP